MRTSKMDPEEVLWWADRILRDHSLLSAAIREAGAAENPAVRHALVFSRARIETFQDRLKA